MFGDQVVQPGRGAAHEDGHGLPAEELDGFQASPPAQEQAVRGDGQGTEQPDTTDQVTQSLEVADLTPVPVPDGDGVDSAVQPQPVGVVMRYVRPPGVELVWRGQAVRVLLDHLTSGVAGQETVQQAIAGRGAEHGRDQAGPCRLVDVHYRGRLEILAQSFLRGWHTARCGQGRDDVLEPVSGHVVGPRRRVTPPRPGPLLSFGSRSGPG